MRKKNVYVKGEKGRNPPESLQKNMFFYKSHIMHIVLYSHRYLFYMFFTKKQSFAVIFLQGQPAKLVTRIHIVQVIEVTDYEGRYFFLFIWHFCYTLFSISKEEKRVALTEPIKNKQHLRQLSEYFLDRGQFRNNLLLVVGAHTALRISDILGLVWNDVYDEESQTFRSHISIKEKKTGKVKVLALHAEVIKALQLYLPHRNGEYIFAGNRKSKKAISRIQAWRVLHFAAKDIGLQIHVSPYSLRKSMGYHAWKSGASPVVLMEIYNHSTYEVTKRYLGISQDEIDYVYLSAALF